MEKVFEGSKSKPLTSTPNSCESTKRFPRLWYSVVFLMLFVLSIVCVQVFDTDLPVWGLIIAILLPALYFLPAAFIYASTAQVMTLNLIAQLVPGFAFAGRPVAVMVSDWDDWRLS